MATEPSLEALAAHLEATGNYRVLRRLTVASGNFVPIPGMKRAIFLDVETTGLDTAKDEIIELAMVPFWYDDFDRIAGVGQPLIGLREPSRPIPEEVTRLTGITPEMVAGHSIDPASVAQFVTNSLVIAHNAGFDRRFLERFCPALATNPWACSMSEIPWIEFGFESVKLSFLGQAYGFYYDGHRAVHDCYAGIEILTRSLPNGGPESVLKTLLTSARSTTWRCWADNSPFDKKDLLKARGYRWTDGTAGTPKAWWIDLKEKNFHGEMGYLRDTIYGGSVRVSTSEMDAFNRYSDRLSIVGYSLPAA